jgi:hypothetical protein
MAITRYAGDRFTVATADTKPTGVLQGAFLINTGNRISYVKTGNSSIASDWVALQGSGGGGTPSGDNLTVQFNDDGVFGGDADLTFTDGNRLNVNKLGISGNVYDSNNWIGEGGMILANEGATGVNWKNIESVLSGVGGSGVANYVARWSDEDTLTTGALVDDGTKVGIGIIAPVAKLHIDDSAIGDNKALYIQNTNNTNDDSANIRFGFAGTDNANKGGIFFKRTASYGRGSLIFATENTATDDNVDNSDAKLTILADGNVGIGAGVSLTNPYYSLNVGFTNNTTVLSGGDSGDYGGDGIRIQNDSTTVGSMAIAHFRTNTADWHIGNRYVSGAASDFFFKHETTEHLTILNDGKVGIGTTDPSQKLDVYNGQIRIRQVAAGDAVLCFTDSGTINSYIRLEDGTAKLMFGTDATEGILTLNLNAGTERLGINNTSPNAQLHVGDASAEGDATNPAIQIGSTTNYRMAFYTTSEGAYIHNKNGDGGVNLVSRDNTILTAGWRDGATVKNHVGIGVTTPQHALHVSGDAIISGVLYDSTNSSGAAGHVFTSEVGGPQWKMIEDVLSGVGGNGTANYVPKWIDSDTIGDSLIYDNATNVGIGTTNPQRLLHVNGDAIVSGKFYDQTNSTGDKGYVLTSDDNGPLWKASGDFDGLSGNLITTGQTLTTDINAVASNLVTTGQTLTTNINGLAGNLGTTGQTLQTQITSNDTEIAANTANLITTGQTLTTNINTVASNLVTSGQTLTTNINGLAGNVGTTGQTLQTQITSNDTEIATNATAIALNASNLILTGTIVDDVSGNLITTGQYLTDEINTVSGLIPPTVVDGAGVTGYTARWYDGNTLTTGALYDDGTNVGIGYTNPTSTLSVGGNSSQTLKPTVSIKDESAGASLALRGGAPRIFMDSMASGIPKILMDSRGIEFKDGTLDSEGNVDVKIAADGKVGIGSAAPVKTLSIEYSNTTTDVTAEGLDGGGAGGGVLIQNGSGDTDGAFANLDFRAHNADARIAYQYRGTANVGDFQFITDNSGTPTVMMTIANDGNVGIGTTAPGAKLEVNGETRVSSSTSYGTHLNYLDGGNNFISTTNSGATYFRGSSNGITTMTVKGDGKVGIGTDGPDELLHVYSSTVDSILKVECHHASSNAVILINSATNRDAKLKFQENGTTKWDFHNDGSDSDKFKISDDGDVRIVFQQDGNVGIGNNLIAPAHRLHVSGDAIISGYLYDSTNSTGDKGYVLTSDDNGPLWKASGDFDGLSGNLITSGQTLTTNINGLAGNVGTTGQTLTNLIASTGSTNAAGIVTNASAIADNTSNLIASGQTLTTNINGLAGNLGTTGQTLQTQITSNDTEIATNATAIALNASNLILTGAIVDDVSGNLITSGQTLTTNINGLAGNVGTTGQTLQTQITSNDIEIAANTSNLVLTGNFLESEIDIVSGLIPPTVVDGAGVANYTARWFDGNTLTTGALVDDGTKVGIGTDTPLALLHLQSTGTLEPVLRIENTHTDNKNPMIHLVKSTTDEADDDYVGQVDFKGMNSAGEETPYGRLQAIATDVTDGEEDGRIYLASMNAGALDATLNVTSGKVGIGTDAPSYGRLQVEQDSGGDGSTPPTIAIHDSQAGPTWTPNVPFAQLTFGNMDVGGAGAGGIKAKIAAQPQDADGTETELAFYTAASGTTTVQRMVINGDGEVGIGTYAPGADLHIGGSALITGPIVAATTLAVSDTTNGAQLVLRGGSPTIFFDKSGADAFPSMYLDGGGLKIFRATPIAPSTLDFMISGGGLVGIGTTDPQELLQVNSDSGDAAIRVDRQAASNEAAIKFGTNGTENWRLGNADSGHTNLQGTEFFISTAGSEAAPQFVIEASGLIGIGTATPGKALEIGDNSNTTGNGTIRLRGYSASGGYHDIVSYGDNLVFYRNTTVGLFMRYNGNVGIGGEPTSHKFLVVGNAKINDDLTLDTTKKIYLDGGGDTYIYESSGNDIRVKAGGNTAFDFIATGAGVPATQKLYVDGGSNTYIQEPAADQMAFVTAGGERVRIIADGKVGIGTTAPSTLLEVTTSNNSSDGTFSSWSTTDGHSGTIIFTKSASATIGTYAATADGERLGTIAAYGSDSGNTKSQSTAAIYFEQDGAATAARVPSRIKFFTAPPSNNMAERMVIRADGNVGIGTTNPGALLEVGADGNTDYALIGPTKIGGGMGHGDYAGFSHRSMGTTTNYCLLQYSDGHTYLNAASGKTVHLRVNNGNILKLSGSLATFDVSALFNGYIELDAGLKDKDGSFGTNGYVLTTDGAGDVTWSASPGAGSVDGSGTAGYIPKWTDGDTIGNSVVYETAAGTIGIHAGTNVEGMVDVQMKMNGVDWTYGDWDEVWCTGGAPGPKFNDCVFHLDTDRAGGVTGGIVGLAFSPGWQGHQNWGIYSTNESGGSYTQGDLRFVNQLNTPAGTFNERVTFKADGNVGIGTTAPGSYKLRVEGDVYISGTLTEASSLAIKENIETYSPSLEKINKIRPVRYNKKKSEKKEVGLVAEELAEMFPELVERDEKGNPAGVNYSRAVAVLLHGFKELYKEVKELKEKI